LWSDTGLSKNARHYLKKAKKELGHGTSGIVPVSKKETLTLPRITKNFS
jgi:hypothetical protein